VLSENQVHVPFSRNIKGVLRVADVYGILPHEQKPTHGAGQGRTLFSGRQVGQLSGSAGVTICNLYR
jgi:hypothetical protein